MSTYTEDGSSCHAPYAALLMRWHKEGSNAIQLGLEPDRHELPKSLWFVHGRGGNFG